MVWLDLFFQLGVYCFVIANDYDQLGKIILKKQISTRRKVIRLSLRP
jgi:hypothetical protein